MRIASAVVWMGLAPVVIACGTRADDPVAPSMDVAAVQAGRASFEWSEPAWLGPVINSPTRELNPELAAGGLSLYFTSEREGGIQIYVSRRATGSCPWEAPVKLGPNINNGDANFSAALSPDGRLLFFARGDHSGQDIYVSRREDPNEDFGWGPSVKLGPEVNTTDNESGPAFLQAGGGEFYFNRGDRPDTKIWVIRMRHDGRTSGEARLVSELNHPVAVNGAVTVRRDGRELIFWSGGAAGERPGTVGLADLFVSTRQNVNEPWGEPRSLGRPVNHEGADLEATLSADGKTLVYSTARPGGLGRQDLWMSVRSPHGESVAEPSNGSGCPSS
ncbi:MAG: hypothetical protein ACRENI_01040 [Gemmatimonadaceae bacterium]